MRDSSDILDHYFNLMGHNGFSYAYRLGNRLSIFNSLLNGPKTVDEIAHNCELKTEPLNLLLKVFESEYLVEIHEQKVTPTQLLFFLQGDYKNLSDEYWTYLEEYLKTGKSYFPVAFETAEFYAKQALSLKQMMAPSAMKVAEILGSIKSAVNILDLGCGSGVWSQALLTQDQSSRSTLIDRMEVMPLAINELKEFGDRTNFVTGDFRENIPNEKFDFALLGNVTHLMSPKDLFSLFSTLKSRLLSEGKIVLVDVFEGSEKGQLNKALYSLGLSLRFSGARTHSRRTLETILRDAGYNHSDFYQLDSPPHVMGMLIAGEEKL